MQWPDALGKPQARFAGAPRIVSLVPSLSELVVDLGLADALVGRTGFCIHPRAVVRGIPKVGGTKGFDLEKVRALAPTHVLVNIDENRREEVERLADFVPHLIVTHPLAPRDNLALYRLFGGVFGRESAAEALCADFEREWAALAETVGALPREDVLYLIWRQPWMSVARATYISRMLAAAGWDTLPADAAARYPEVELPTAALPAARVLLSSEPYPFRARHVEELVAMNGLAGKLVHTIDGEMVSWYGSRAPRGLRYLRALRAAGAAGRGIPPELDQNQ